MEGEQKKLNFNPENTHLNVVQNTYYQINSLLVRLIFLLKIFPEKDTETIYKHEQN